MNWWLALLLVLGGGVAGADPISPPADYSHRGQLQVSARLALGLRAIVPYESSDYCGQTDNGVSNAPVCTGRAPFSFDLELGYGIAQRVDLILEMRLGLETDFATTVVGSDGPRTFHLAPGARFFFSDAKTSKLFTTAQLVLDFSREGTDVGVRNMNGLWFDLDRAYGLYAYVAETATFSRWLRFELEAGVGFSARFR